jgi:hypothetical protein
MHVVTSCDRANVKREVTRESTWELGAWPPINHAGKITGLVTSQHGCSASRVGVFCLRGQPISKANLLYS